MYNCLINREIKKFLQTEIWLQFTKIVLKMLIWQYLVMSVQICIKQYYALAFISLTELGISLNTTAY